MTMTVCGGSISPFVRKVLVGLAEKGLPHEHVSVLPHDKSEAFRTASPFGKIPAFRHGDFAISDSTAILTYLDAVQPAPAFYPAGARERASATWFEEFADTILATAAGAYLFETVIGPRFFGQKTEPAKAQATLEQKLPPMLDYLERELAGRRFLVGDAFTVAELAVGAHLGSLGAAGVAVDAARWPALAAWNEANWRRPSFAACAEKDRRALAA